MGSERSATDGASALSRLTAVLTAAAGSDASGETEGPTPRELAELLWLASRLAPNDVEGPSRKPADHPRPDDAPAAPSGPTAVPPRPTPPPPRSPPSSAVDGRIPLHLPEQQLPNGRPGPLLLAPAPPMLHHPLALQRALRPLKRKVPAPRARVLDEHATADRIARLGARPEAWLPVLRPAPDRWLRLNLVYDAGPTMPVWRPLVRELHTALAQSGIFRSITLHPATPDGRARHVPDPADGRTVTLIVSDCMGPQWRPGTAGTRWYRTLHHWAARMPVAVLQPLPEHLWPTTALPAEPGLLTSPTAAAPTARLTFTPYDPDAPRSGTALPVLEPGPTWLANWATLTATPGGAHMPGAAARLTHTPVPPSAPAAPDIAALPAQDLVLHFRSTASVEAFRLAGHLALAVPSLPVMRLVQRALEGRPRPQHLAEIILSGLLTTVPGPPGSYDFRPGVRSLLLRSLPRTVRGRNREFLARVGGLIDEWAAFFPGEFPAELGGREGTEFATVREETVRRLGGPAEGTTGLLGGRYRLIGQRGPSRRMWAAVDLRTDRPVVVHLYPEQAAPQERFLREAGVLANLIHPNLARVLDYGVEGEKPYLVAEFVDGLTVAELEKGSGPGISFDVFARLVLGAVPALHALHGHGLVRGQSGWDGLLLRPDGTVVLSRFALGEQSEGHDASSDLFEFLSLLRNLASTGLQDRRFQQALARLSERADSDHVLRQLAQSPAFEPENTGTEPLSATMLGPLRISRGNRLLELPDPEAQALLHPLLLKQGLRVTHTELAEGLWEQPPGKRDAARRLRPLASALRECLGPGTLATLSDGYALHAPDAYIDVLRCEQLLARRSSEQNPRGQRALIQEVLNLWYGDPLDGVPGPAAGSARTRLRALRLSLCATRAELDLELGDFEQAATDLTTLLQNHPDREDFRRLHMLALQGMGRIAEAIESYEAYVERREPQHSDPIDPALEGLYRELRAAPERDRPTIVFEALGLSEHAQARHALGRAVTRLLSEGELAPHQYEVLARTDGYVVLTEPEADVLPVLSAVLHELPEGLSDLEDPPPFRVTFWHAPWFAAPDRPVLSPEVQTVLDRTDADILVVVSPALHEEFADSSSTVDAAAFQPLRPGSPATPPLAWYRRLRLPPAAPVPEPEPRDLVDGPFTTPDLDRLDAPDPGRTAIVHTRPDGPLTLLNPAHPWGKRPPRPTTYYEVDLTTHQAAYEVALPSSGGGTFAASVELSWHVDDPVAYLLSETPNVAQRLLDHLLKEASRITRRHPLGRAGAAQHAVHDGLHRWPVPGVTVACSVRLTPEGEVAGPTPQQSPHSASPLTDLLRGAETVLIGFEGPLTRMFSEELARAAAFDLLHVANTAAGPLPPSASAERWGAAHPLDVLRAFAGHPVAPRLSEQLDQLELQAVGSAWPTPHAASLIQALHASGRRVVVVTDCSPPAVHRFLEACSLSVDGVHGRKDRVELLMPNPDCLLRAMRSPGTPARVGLVISSSAAELDAADSIGLRRIGYARTPSADRALRTTGCDLVLGSLEPLLEAARSL